MFPFASALFFASGERFAVSESDGRSQRDRVVTDCCPVVSGGVLVASGLAAPVLTDRSTGGTR